MSRFFASALLAVLLSGACAAPASAQSINPALDRTERERQVVAAVTLPLGRSSDPRRTAPRFEIISRSQQAGTDLDPLANRFANRWEERRFGVTLDTSLAPMINGRPVDGPSEQMGASTVGTVAIVLGISAVIAGTVLVIHGMNVAD